MSIMASGLSIPSNAQYGQHIWTQWYRTEDSSDRVGTIVYVIDAELNPTTPYTVTVKAGSKPFPSLEQAEVWLQSRIRSGAKIERC